MLASHLFINPNPNRFPHELRFISKPNRITRKHKIQAWVQEIRPWMQDISPQTQDIPPQTQDIPHLERV